MNKNNLMLRKFLPLTRHSQPFVDQFISHCSLTKIIFALTVNLGICAAAGGWVCNTGVSDDNNRRFLPSTTTANPQYLGAAYDLSGITTVGPEAGSMISPHYFVTATHFGPYAVGSVLTFVNRNGQTITKTCAGSRTMTTLSPSGSVTKTSDVTIGKLVGAGITAADNIGFAPIMVPFKGNIHDNRIWDGFANFDMFVHNAWGNVSGVNRIEAVTQYSSGGYKTAGIRFFYDTTALQPEEAGVTGESGSPWGLIVNGKFTLGGVHSAIQSYDNGSVVCYSSFLPYYVDQINAYIREAHPNEQVTLAANPMVMGQKHFVGVTTDVLVDPYTPIPAEWVNDFAQLRLTNCGAADKEVRSVNIDLRAVDTVHFRASVRVVETNTASNFVNSDRFKAELIIDDGTPISLVSQWDTGNGASATGPNGAPDGYLNGYQGAATGSVTATDDYNIHKARDEFNPTGRDAASSLNHVFNLRYTIPPEADKVRLRISGAGFNNGKSVTVSDIIFSGVPDDYDLDSDGVPDITELIQGTDPKNPISIFKIASLLPSPTVGTQLAQYSTVRDRRYQGYVSSNLLDWTKSGPSIAGTGNTAEWPLVQQPATTPRQFLRIQSGHTDADFPTTTP